MEKCAPLRTKNCQALMRAACCVSLREEKPGDRRVSTCAIREPLNSEEARAFCAENQKIAPMQSAAGIRRKRARRLFILPPIFRRAGFRLDIFLPVRYNII